MATDLVENPITKENVHRVVGDIWNLYKKKETISLHKIEGPFSVDGSNGVEVCQDGFVGIDKRGVPFAISSADVQRYYEKVT